MLQEIETKEIKEESAFSEEFVSIMAEYAEHHLYEVLRKLGASKDAICLLQALVQVREVELMYAKDGKAHPHWNIEMADALAEISQCVVKLGGVFVSPTLDTSVPRT